MTKTTQATQLKNGTSDGREPWRLIHELATRTLAHFDGSSDAYQSIIEAIAQSHRAWLADSLIRFVSVNCKRLTLSLREGVLKLATQIRNGDQSSWGATVSHIERYKIPMAPRAI